jgi:hypothetical protein
MKTGRASALPFFAMKYQLLKNSTYGAKGQFIELLDGNEARQLAVHGVISLEPVVQKVNGPEITKVVEPEVKKRGRPRKENASDTTD